MNTDEVLRELEEELFKSSTRKNAERVSSLLANGFREFGSSGQAYSKIQIITSLQSESPVHISMKDFQSELLSSETALVTYRALKQEPGGPITESLRSSIWIFQAGRWQMLFHQGTKTPQTR